MKQAQEPTLSPFPSIADNERIQILRERCLDRKQFAWQDGRILAAAKAMRESEKEPWLVRMGLRTRRILEDLVFSVDNCEVLLGRLAPAPESVTEQDIEDAKSYLSTFTWASGQTGHCELDLSQLFELGIDGLLAYVDRLEAEKDQTCEPTYEAMKHALSGLQTLILNAAKTAEDAISKASDARQRELDYMRKRTLRIAHEPPQHFYDAIQLLWFVDLAVMHGDHTSLIVPGHIDRTLLSFYEADIRAGYLSKSEALLLVESLYLLINEYVKDGLAMSVMAGGRDADGKAVCNDLSFLALQALKRVRLVYPTVGICWHEETPEELVELAVGLIADGCSNPAFFGDEVIQRGLKALGLSDQESCNYINSTCVEITPVGISNTWVASPYYNLCQILLDNIAAQAESEKSPTTFNEFQTVFQKALSNAVAEGVALQNEIRRDRQKFGGKPLQSLFTGDCLQCGRDIDDGGARCNWVECAFVGLANLVDSLLVIREEIYTQKKMNLAELHDLLQKNFAGAEAARQRLLQAYPKYGNNEPESDRLVNDTVQFLVEDCKRYRMFPDDSPFVPGAFVWVMHEKLGRETGATPDGRKAGFPFADGCGPAQGRERHGPTAAILSTTSWDHSSMIGGLAYNMKFDKSLFSGSKALQHLKGLIVSYLRLGGFEVQVNVIDPKALLRARKEPEHYRDLVVRIGGYTDYFVRLSPEMQDEIILRTQFTF